MRARGGWKESSSYGSAGLRSEIPMKSARMHDYQRLSSFPARIGDVCLCVLCCMKPSCSLTWIFFLSIFCCNISSSSFLLRSLYRGLSVCRSLSLQKSNRMLFLKGVRSRRVFYMHIEIILFCFSLSLFFFIDILFTSISNLDHHQCVYTFMAPKVWSFSTSTACLLSS